MPEIAAQPLSRAEARFERLLRRQGRRRPALPPPGRGRDAVLLHHRRPDAAGPDGDAPRPRHDATAAHPDKRRRGGNAEPAAFGRRLAATRRGALAPSAPLRVAAKRDAPARRNRYNTAQLPAARRVPKESADGDRSGPQSIRRDRRLRKPRRGPARPRRAAHPHPRYGGGAADLRRGDAGLRRRRRPSRPLAAPAADRPPGWPVRLSACRGRLSERVRHPAVVAAYQPVFRGPPAGTDTARRQEQRRQLARPARSEPAAGDPRRRWPARRQGG